MASRAPVPRAQRTTPDAPYAQEAPARDPALLREQVIAALRTVYDPEIPVNIYDLGLVYALDVDPAGEARIRMTLTAPACPVAQTFPETVQRAVDAVPGVTATQVELVWEPRWTHEMMSEAARLELGML
jgi:FeS assembly SUF system protein